MDDKRIAYTAANALPLKVLQNETAQKGLSLGRILPVHFQFIPTDRCNLKCSWCSCANDSRQTTMSLDDVKYVVDVMKRWSTKAITCTGGGEPLMHPQIREILNLFADADIEIGLVTNAYLFESKMDYATLRRLKWCRISVSDDRDLHTNSRLIQAVDWAVREPTVDWAFSYVCTKDFDLDRFLFAVEYATAHGFTHVRAVSDLLDLEHVPSMDSIRARVRAAGVDDSIVIYQGRKDFEKGQKRCLISLLKPVVGADGRIWGCCGVQYSKKQMSLDLPDDMCMGSIYDLDDIFAKGKHFDGSRCFRCYYSLYNNFLNQLTTPIEHGDFV